MKPTPQSDRSVTMAVLVALAAAEWAFVGPQVFAIAASDAADSMWRLLPLLGMPRLIIGLCAGLVLAVVDNRAMRVVALLTYIVLLLWSFYRSDVYVRWRDLYAVAQVVIPYASGLVGMGIGFALRGPVRRSLNMKSDK
jgi:uncharacterized membrane protein YfcA